MTQRRPLLAISMGDPAGIGPEVILKAATVNDVRAESELMVFGDAGVLRRAARDIGIDVEVVEIQQAEEAAEHQGTRALPVVSVSRLGPKDYAWGQPTPASDAVQIDFIKRAFDAVWTKKADAIVTAPINKISINRAGAHFAGHTEMLAQLAGGVRPLMMLAGPSLKVVPITTHVPLRDVPGLLNEDLVSFAIQVVHEAFQRHFARRRPRIAVAGLNPHAGEDGLFGKEEAQIIRPAIEAANAKGIQAQGPFPSDTIYQRTVAGEYDVVIGMYHDQALIPLKMLDFDKAVNVTLGLPFIRTSVDHGTAYDIAGSGVASANSMIAAMRMAGEMVIDSWDSSGNRRLDAAGSQA
ncbi:MAG: 4-hydroxythreonine-4-phosphate dehydrogenase PdxA [Myxococcota bacterium]